MKKSVFSIISVLCASLAISFTSSFKVETPVFAEGENRITLETNQEVIKGNTYSKVP